MNDGEPSLVHQILLGLKGGEGVAVVAHSMTSDGEASSWQRKLEKHVRLLPWEAETTLPGKALSYYRFGSHAVVLRRWAAGGSLGRSDAHALIGSIDVLTAPVALGLDSGFDWQRAADTVPTPIIGRELASLAGDACAELRDQATGKPELLRRTLGKLIDARDKPLTIIGCPDDHRVALTWALVYIGDEYLTKKCEISRRWTFSTYEIEDADSIPNVPEILFMPGRPTGRGVATRVIVDVRRDDAVIPGANEWSELLVQRFIAREPLVPEFNNSISVSVSKTAVSATGQPEQRERECTSDQPMSDQLMSDHRQHQAGSNGYPQERRQGTVGHSPTPQAPAGHRSGSKWLEREIDLLRAEDEHGFDWRLDTLGRLGRTLEERAEIRRLLGVDDYLRIVVMITGWRPVIENGLDRLQRFRVVTFGLDGRDLSDRDAAAFAVQIVAHPAAPAFFVNGLVQEIDAHGQSDLVDPALAARWREQKKSTRDLAGTSPYGYPPREPAEAGPLGAVMSVLAQRRWPLAAAVGLVLLVPLFFVLGRYSVDAETAVARSNSAGNQAAPATSSDPASAPAGQDPAKRGITEVSGGVTTNDLVIRAPSWAVEGSSVFLLLRAVGKDEIYPQGECKVDAHEWICAKIPLTQPVASLQRFEILVVEVDPQVKQSYYMALDTKKALQNPPDAKAVIFKITG
ncbi:MAG: hypothetical protein ACRDTA_16590 [Pseudonocardiaceae bacterium]